MNRLIITLLWVCTSFFTSGQQLLDIYKSGTVKLVADETYAKQNDWNEVFKTYYDTLYGKPMGNRKSLKVMPDGKVVVNHAYRNYYSKFSTEGDFLKEFGVTNGYGCQKKETNAIAGIVNNNIFFSTVDNLGNMLCFDFEGKHIKDLKFNYMVRQFVALPKGKIAVVGWAIWESKFRDFVAIVDYETNKEKIIWSHFTDRNSSSNGSNKFNYLFKFAEGTDSTFWTSINTMPFSKLTGMKAPPQIACVNNQLIIADPMQCEMQIFDLNGGLISKKKMDLKHNHLSIEEQKQIQQKAIDEYKQMDPERFAKKGWGSIDESVVAHQYFINEMEADLKKITEPFAILKPYFSTLIKDSDENLLYFEFPKTEGANVFNVYVYENGGAFLCKSSFVCSEYNLQINPDKMVFHKGYIYALQNKKETDAVPLRLVRFKVMKN